MLVHKGPIRFDPVARLYLAPIVVRNVLSQAPAFSNAGVSDDFGSTVAMCPTTRSKAEASDEKAGEPDRAAGMSLTVCTKAGMAGSGQSLA